mgnify:CR=1 FL=1
MVIFSNARRLFIAAILVALAFGAGATAQAPSWPNACHICEVEIDPDTGVVQVASYASVNDVGRAINPTIVIGQLDGGAVQGLGQFNKAGFVRNREQGAGDGHGRGESGRGS